MGYNITVYDNTTPAVTAAGNKIPIDKFYFYSADGKALGYMLGNEMTALQNKSVINNAGSWEAPGCGGDWQAWFAQQFNLYRGLGGNMGAAAGGVPNIGSGSAADEAPLFPIKTDADIEALRDEVIRLTNVEREKAGMPELEADDFTMDYAQIRAEEIVTSFSHVRPNNESDMPGGFSFMEIIHFGSPTASQAVQAWMKSPGHRVTLLCDYSDYGNRFGVGVYQTPNGNLYWVQEFLAWDPNA